MNKETLTMHHKNIESSVTIHVGQGEGRVSVTTTSQVNAITIFIQHRTTHFISKQKYTIFKDALLHIFLAPHPIESAVLHYFSICVYFYKTAISHIFSMYCLIETAIISSTPHLLQTELLYTFSLFHNRLRQLFCIFSLLLTYFRTILHIFPTFCLLRQLFYIFVSFFYLTESAILRW